MASSWTGSMPNGVQLDKHTVDVPSGGILNRNSMASSWTGSMPNGVQLDKHTVDVPSGGILNRSCCFLHPTGTDPKGLTGFSSPPTHTRGLGIDDRD